MDSTIIIRIVSGVLLAVIVMAFLIQRRRTRVS